MAVPKKKTSKSRTQTRYKTFVKTQQRKLMNFVERAKRNERGLAKVTAAPKKSTTKKKVTKIAA
jgi:ribosomal protein L32